VAHCLKELVAHPSDIKAFSDLWPYMCSEGTAWSSAFAAAPYVVEIAASLPPQQRLDHLYFLGLVEMCGGREECPPHLKQSYTKSVSDALALTGETLACHHDVIDTRYLLAAVAALKGHPHLGELLNHLDCGCPHCGAMFLHYSH
jgi:hypothetical protein